MEAPTIINLSDTPDLFSIDVGAAGNRPVAASTNVWHKSCIMGPVGKLGFAIHAAAPSDLARSAPILLPSIAPASITTGIGRKRIKCAKNSRPLIPGISMSSVRTSGFVWLITLRASSAVPAAPTISSLESCEMTLLSQRRIDIESSTMTTLYV
ncbi:MAG: hypothetical protein ABJG73_16670 [Tateyamaria sp.]